MLLVAATLLAAVACRPEQSVRPRDAAGPRRMMHAAPPTGPALPTGAPAIAVGASAVGELTATDTALPTGPVADSYTVTLTANQRVTIIARGGPSNSTPGSLLDVYCEVLQADRVLANDDDGAASPEGARNCRVLFQAPAAGTYTLRVRTAGPARGLGPYNVQVYSDWLEHQL